MVSFAPVLAAHRAPTPIVVRRFPESVLDADSGLIENDAPSSTTMDAVVQPSGPKDVERLPEGERTIESIVIFTSTPLVAADVTAQVRSDEIEWRGKRYEVRAVEDWTQSVLPHSKAIAVRVGD